MTENELAVIAAFTNVSFQLGSSGKRFARDMIALAKHDPSRELSDRQKHYLAMVAWRYRRQMPSRLVPESDPGPLPPRESKRNSRLRSHEPESPGSKKQMAVGFNSGAATNCTQLPLGLEEV